MNKILSWFENLVPPFPDLEDKKPPKGLFKFILFFTKGLWKYLCAVAIFTSLMAIGEALFFICLGLIVDWTSAIEPIFFIEKHGIDLIFMFLLAGILLPIATSIHSLLLYQTISSNYPMQIRWKSHNYLLNQSLSFFSNEFAGSLANKLMQTAIAVRTSVLKLLDVCVHMLVYIMTMIILLANADILLTLPIFVWLILYCFSMYIFIPRLRMLSQEQSEKRSNMVGRIVDSYTNIETVKLFGGFSYESDYAKDGMKNFMQSELKALRYLTFYNLSVQFMNYALLIVITILALYLWASNSVTSGAIAIAVAVAIRLINMSRWIMWEVSAIFENIGIVYDGMRTLSKPLTITDPKDPISIDKLHGNIEFKNVSFYYKKNNIIFNDLSFTIHEKEKVGIVGPSGCGKSTLVNLLLRFYDVIDGAICIDGINIKDIKQDVLRDNFAMVTQNTNLLHRTIAENIAYGRELDRESIERAASLTDAKSFIEELSDFKGSSGFECLVGERGSLLSGGQRQKIALARVIIKDSPIFIFDEATSALDSHSEMTILENLEQVMKDRTVIAIAHRLSTLMKIDRIIVMDKGKIVEQGSHEELLSKNGLYKDLWQRQINGFLPS